MPFWDALTPSPLTQMETENISFKWSLCFRCEFLRELQARTYHDIVFHIPRMCIYMDAPLEKCEIIVYLWIKLLKHGMQINNDQNTGICWPIMIILLLLPINLDHFFSIKLNGLYCTTFWTNFWSMNFWELIFIDWHWDWSFMSCTLVSRYGRHLLNVRWKITPRETL